MEDSNVVSQTSSPSKDFSSEAKSFNNECSCSMNHREEEFGLPICFLVKEQAKSFVAIQDLQNRVSRVENVQEDVIDAILDFRNQLCDTRSFSSPQRNATSQSLVVDKSSDPQFPKFNRVSKSATINVPCTASESSVEVPQAVPKSRSYSCVPSLVEYGRLQQANAVVPAPKHFELMKSKDSALESDKQDSGLDSDCRDTHETHPSLVKGHPEFVNSDGNDELLQLLDEIGHRSVLLQRQLAVSDDVSTGPKDRALSEYDPQTVAKPKLSYSVASLADPQRRLTSTTIFEQGGLAAEKVPILEKQSSDILRLFEDRSICDNSFGRKRAASGIDSAVVSDILKDGNVVELQRKALVYVVDNAVLQTRLQEFEQLLSSSKLEGEKVENALKEEARLLMMENRELRISLDEQRLESNSLKSRIAILERALQSVSSENQELNWQLGETLNLQNYTKPSQNTSRPMSSLVAPKSGRKVSLGPSHSFRKDISVHCVKSKLLSDNSSFMDITVDETEEDLPEFAPASGVISKRQNGPMFASTPFQKQKELKSILLNSSMAGDKSPANFHSVKKCLQGSHHSQNGDASVKSSQSRRFSGEAHPGTDSENRPQKCLPSASSSREEAVPSEGIGKFPFNTILEKLKANSEYRLTRNVTQVLLADKNESNPRLNATAPVPGQETENLRHSKETKSLQGNSDTVSQRKKGRNIQQRIQNILDRIVAESEDCS